MRRPLTTPAPSSIWRSGSPTRALFAPSQTTLISSGWTSAAITITLMFHRPPTGREEGDDDDFGVGDVIE